MRLLFEDIFEPPNDSPMLVVLNYSGGAQSHCIAKMLLRGGTADAEMPSDRCGSRSRQRT